MIFSASDKYILIFCKMHLIIENNHTLSLQSEKLSTKKQNTLRYLKREKTGIISKLNFISYIVKTPLGL